MSVDIKIGIITHHYIKNYGAFLQAYSLQEILRELYPNAEVEIISYINRKHYFSNLRPLLIGKPKSKSLIKAVKLFLDDKMKLLQYHKAMAHLNISPWCRNASDINKRNYDAIFIGSDEVWNVNSVSLDKVKFAIGLSCPNIISYAPSVGNFKIEQSLPDFVIEGLQKFTTISVRDTCTYDMVKQNCDCDIALVLDPTLLYDFNKTDTILETPINHPYLLVYQCVLNEKQINIMKKFAKTNGLLIIGAGCHEDWFDKSIINITPFEWVKLFNCAKYVVTGTFHGTIFAIKSKAKFVAYPTQVNRVEKIKSLLKSFGLEQQVLFEDEKYNICKHMTRNIDYDTVYRKLEVLKHKSNEFLKKSIINLKVD